MVRRMNGSPHGTTRSAIRSIFGRSLIDRLIRGTLTLPQARDDESDGAKNSSGNPTASSLAIDGEPVDKRYIIAAEAAEIAHCSVKTIRRAFRPDASPRLKSIPGPGRCKYLTTVEWVHEWLEARRQLA
jgi:hypothetical protein